MSELLSEYQEWTETCAFYPTVQDSHVLVELLYLGNGLASEAGEVCGVIKKMHRDGFDSVKLEKLKKEVGDVMWYISQIANSTGFTIEDFIMSNMDKLEDRKSRDVLAGDGDDR